MCNERGTKTKRKKGDETTSKKPRKGAEPGLNITPEENRRYVRNTMEKMGSS